MESRLSTFAKAMAITFVLVGLYLTSLYSYLLLHTLAELFSIVIGATIFVMAWNFRRFYRDSFLLFIGTAYLFFSFIDLLHTLAFKGMGVFVGYDANLPTQLWIAARYLQSISLLVAPLFLGRRVGARWLVGGFAAVTGLLLLSIFAWEIFPVAYVEGVGLTPFKIASEYVIDLILACAIAVLLLFGRKRLDRKALRYLAASIALTMLGELAFTFYIDVYDFSNLVGHYFKIFASLLVYKATIESEAGSIYTSMAALRRTERALRKSEAEARRSLAELHSIYALSPVGLCFLDPQMRFQTVNAEMARLDGLAIEAHIGKPLPEAVPAAIANQVEPLLRQVLATGKPLLNQELEAFPAGRPGLPGTWLFSASPAVEPDGRILGINCVVQDISERQQSEAALKAAHTALQDYAAKLQRSNRDLEQFAFIASHDLKEPLRKIIFFGDSVQRLLGGNLTEQTQDHLFRMQRAAERMQTMIDGLLELSRVNTRAAGYEPAELTLLAQEAASDLAARIKETHGEVVIEPLPSAEVDVVQMRRLFQNMIGNALKFHRPDAVPVVRVVGGVDGAGEASCVTIHIEDNGIGFDENETERIFIPFQRLHGRSEYEGNGLGLAICQKIVERHNGRIEVHSRPGTGTVFTVILPVRQPGRPPAVHGERPPGA